VKFNSRISDPVYGKITFTNKKESNISAAALVFDLKSSITGRNSLREWQFHSNLYERSMMDIQVTNPFPNVEYADFHITLVHEKYKAPLDEKVRKQISKKKKKVKKKKIMHIIIE
jgi:hypothetical protein